MDQLVLICLVIVAVQIAIYAGRQVRQIRKEGPSLKAFCQLTHEMRMLSRLEYRSLIAHCEFAKTDGKVESVFWTAYHPIKAVAVFHKSLLDQTFLFASSDIESFSTKGTPLDEDHFFWEGTLAEVIMIETKLDQFRGHWTRSLTRNSKIYVPNNFRCNFG